MRETAAAFGMDGEDFEIPLPVVDSHVGDIVDDAALGQTSIGQRDVRMTPLQAAMLAATVANDGSLMAPYLVDQVRRPIWPSSTAPAPTRCAARCRPTSPRSSPR